MQHKYPNTIWHPMTQHAVMPPEIAIRKAEGAYLYSEDGREILDGISSWWVNIHGHCHPKIVQAVQAQAAELEQVIFAGFTHAPAEELAEGLITLSKASMGGGHKHVFFSDSGSTAIEVALKMAIGYWEHTGQPRQKMIALEGGYHGDTFGAMAAGARGVFNQMYDPFLFEVQHIPVPSPGKEDEALDRLEAILKEDGAEIAAFIFEPLVQGAAGFQMYHPDRLRAMYDLCKEYDVLMIADEVMTGFGRTGTMFACEQAGFAPDLMCLSKGLTAGFLPMGATLCTSEIYEAFFENDRSKTFFHSTSFTGNALACAAANASLKIWREEPVMDNIRRISARQEEAAQMFDAREDVVGVRQMGTLLAIDARIEERGYLSNIGPKLYDLCLSRDVLLRPIGETLYVLPPYCVTNEDLEKIYDCITFALRHIGDDREQRAA